MSEEEGEGGEYVTVSRKRMAMYERAASEIKSRDARVRAYKALVSAYEPLADRERNNLLSEGHYNNSEDLTKYIRFVEEVEPGRAARLWEDIADENLGAELPDVGVVKEAANRLQLLGYDSKAKGIRDKLKTKAGTAQEAVFRGAGWGETTMRYRRPGLAKRVITSIFVASLLGVFVLATGSITGNVTGASATSTAWTGLLSLVALLAGLFLILRKE